MASNEIIECDFDEAAMVTLAEEFCLDPLRHPRDNSKIRASTIGNCPRAITHTLLGSDTQPVTAHKNFTFWQGHALGDAMTFVLIRLGWVKAEPYIDEDGQLAWRGNTEEEVEDELFKGHYDIFTEPLKRVKIEKDGIYYDKMVVTSYDDPEGKRYLLDFKTMTDRVGFFYQTKDKSMPELKTPKSGGNQYLPIAGCLYPGDFTKLEGFPKSYWEQLHIYARIKKADGLMLVVMAKDAVSKLCYYDQDYLLNFPVKVFTSEGLDADTLAEIDAKAELIYSYANKGELHPIPEGYTPDKIPCSYCDFNHHCWKNEHSKKPGLAEIRPIAFDNLTAANEKR